MSRNEFLHYRVTGFLKKTVAKLKSQAEWQNKTPIIFTIKPIQALKPIKAGKKNKIGREAIVSKRAVFLRLEPLKY
jgi:hypothetical protein